MLYRYGSIKVVLCVSLLGEIEKEKIVKEQHGDAELEHE
jgi:hypothetical protein